MPARLKPHIPLMVHTALTLLIAFAAMNSQNNILFWVFGVMLAALLTSLLVPHLMMRGVEIRRLDPDHGTVGEPLVVRYAVTNRRRFLPVFNLLIDETRDGGSANWMRFARAARSWVMHIAPGETVHGETVLWPRARGEMRFDRLRCWTTFPFGLNRRCINRRQSTHTLIYPRRYPIRRSVLEAIIPRGPLGTKLSSRPGGGDDFFGLREYKPGDSRRIIAWKRSAGVNDLVIIERTLPSPPRIRVLLNLLTPTEKLQEQLGQEMKARRVEEGAVSLAASIIDAACNAGYEVGLSVLGCEAPVTPIRKSYWHLEKMLGTLAGLDLDADPERTSRAIGARADAERAGLVVIHAGRVDPAVVSSDAWHFSALQMEHLIQGNLSPDPKPLYHRHEPGKEAIAS